jgi:type II secretory pathway pseudopilin PulG
MMRLSQQPGKHETALRPNARRGHGGFTLVEMLVSVALVVLMMGIFASAFQIATGVMLRQRGVAENDQRARSIVTMLQGDLQKRTYRQRSDAVTHTLFSGGTPLEINVANTANRNALGIVPLHPDYFIDGIGGKGRAVDAERERGYLYISENDPANDADDVIQFTVDANNTELANSDTTPYTGRARPLGLSWAAGSAINVDQPIWDDGIGFKILDDGTVLPFTGEDTGTSDSSYAEVSVFLRNGNLMRRVLLIREPGIDSPPGPTGEEEQPTADTPAVTEFIPGNYTGTEDLSPTVPGGSDFWNDHDFSATRLDAPSVRMRFNVASDLDNSTIFTSGVRPNALGNPQNRFGHDPATDVLQGRPKEHFRPDRPDLYFGRYTHEETSHAAFQFPGTPGPLPFSPTAFVPIDALPVDGTIDQFAGGPRQGEDILMTNVHAFDIKGWDAALGDWADMGHARTILRDFTRDGGLGDEMREFGDWNFRHVFDPANPQGTWETVSTTGVLAGVVFPFQSARRAMYRYGSLDPTQAVGLVGVDGQPGIAGLDDNGNNNADDPAEVGWPGSDDLINRVFDTWHPQFNFDTDTDAGAADPSELALDGPPPFRPLWSDRSNFDIQSAGGAHPLNVRGVGGNRVPFNQWMRPVVWQPGQTYRAIPPAGPIPTDPSVPRCRVFPIPRERVGEGFYPGHQSMFYQVVADPNDPNRVYTSGAAEPAWPAVAGEEVLDGDVRWRAVNNTVGLQAIQITIRFLDPTSRQMRQVTIVHSLVEQ